MSYLFFVSLLFLFTDWLSQAALFRKCFFFSSYLNAGQKPLMVNDNRAYYMGHVWKNQKKIWGLPLSKLGEGSRSTFWKNENDIERKWQEITGSYLHYVISTRYESYDTFLDFLEG
jgi:hypothetical protein